MYFLVIVAAAWFLNSFVITRDVVSGNSMYDTLNDGDILMVDLVSYRFSSPKRFDIVVFPSPFEKNVNIVKRVIGLPNETVMIGDDGAVIVNGRMIKDRYGTEVILDPGLAGGDGITLGSDEYFVLGDNRNDSLDSRSYEIGNVKRKKIKGKAFVVIWPFKNFGKVTAK
ncbi:MAG: signal peptidase I [Lachnospiraceae bacterium]|nr:signal peptidase I [Lachnospiraceae bacterium]